MGLAAASEVASPWCFVCEAPRCGWPVLATLLPKRMRLHEPVHIAAALKKWELAEHGDEA